MSLDLERLRGKWGRKYHIRQALSDRWRAVPVAGTRDVIEASTAAELDLALHDHYFCEGKWAGRRPRPELRENPPLPGRASVRTTRPSVLATYLTRKR